MAVQAGDVRLLQPHEVVPRPDLAAVGVAGELQADAVRRRRRRSCAAGARAGHRARAGSRPASARGEVGAVAAGEAAAGAVVDAGEVEAGAAVADARPARCAARGCRGARARAIHSSAPE